MLKITGILNELSDIVEITDSSVFHGGMDDHLIFRGQADEKWSLLPKIFRDDFKYILFVTESCVFTTNLFYN